MKKYNEREKKNEPPLSVKEAREVSKQQHGFLLRYE
jgi:hypothetical protein